MVAPFNSQNMKRINIENRIITIDITPMVFVELSEQWSQLFEKNNWYDFQIINLELEKDLMLDGFEVKAALLGFCFRLRWNYFTDDNEIIQRANEVEKSTRE